MQQIHRASTFYEFEDYLVFRLHQRR